MFVINVIGCNNVVVIIIMIRVSKYINGIIGFDKDNKTVILFVYFGYIL